MFTDVDFAYEIWSWWLRLIVLRTYICMVCCVVSTTAMLRKDRSVWNV